MLVDSVDAVDADWLDAVLTEVLELSVEDDELKEDAVLNELVLVESVDALEGVNDDDVVIVDDVESVLGVSDDEDVTVDEDCVLVLCVLVE